MKKDLTPKEIEKIITQLYIEMKIGKTYEDKAWKEAYILNSMLKAMDLDFKMKRLNHLNGKAPKSA